MKIGAAEKAIPLHDVVRVMAHLTMLRSIAA